MTVDFNTNPSDSSASKVCPPMANAEFVSPNAVFEFVDEPPEPTRGRNPLYSAFADALRENPGRWAVWPRSFKNRSSAGVTAGNIKRGRMANFPSGHFDALSRDGKLYVRFVGGQA